MITVVYVLLGIRMMRLSGSEAFRQKRKEKWQHHRNHGNSAVKANSHFVLECIGTGGREFMTWKRRSGLFVPVLPPLFIKLPAAVLTSVDGMCLIAPQTGAGSNSISLQWACWRACHSITVLCRARVPVTASLSSRRIRGYVRGLWGVLDQVSKSHCSRVASGRVSSCSDTLGLIRLEGLHWLSGAIVAR